MPAALRWQNTASGKPILTETQTIQPATISVVDRAISFFSPKWATQRMAWRGVMRGIEASYKGGVPTRTSENWQPASASRFGLASERSQQASARNRAYQAFKNNPVARTLIQTECDNVIGDGLNYQPTTLSTAWNEEAVDRYYKWLDSCSVRGGDIHSGSETQRLLWQRSRIAGDVGWALISKGSDSLIQMIPAERIVTPDGMYGDKDVVDGIRFDEYGAPSVFYVLIQDDRAGVRKFQPIGARDFVFFANMTDPNGARGESAFITIFDLLSHLDRYVDGVSLAAWMATVFGIVFKQADAAKQLNMLSTMTNSQGNPQKALTIENGMVKYIGATDEAVQVDAKQPMQQTPQFINAMYRMLGQPFDMPLEMIAKNMSECTFSSARIGLLPFYRSCRIKAGSFGHRWSRTIRWWLSRERLRGRDDPKCWRTPFPQDYWNHELLVNAWEYTDPVSEAQADLLQADMGSKSMQMIIAERGRDGEKIVRERLEWQEKTKDLPTVRGNYTRDTKQLVTAVDANGNPIVHVDAPLNGAQLTGALEVLGKLRDRAISDEAAVALLSGMGIDEEVATNAIKKTPRLGDGTPDVAYMREILKLLLPVPQAREAVYNATKIEGKDGLVAGTGLPQEPGYIAPFAAIIAPTGPLNSGAVITDPAGDIVGADVENDQPSQAASEAGSVRNADPAQNAKDGGDGSAQNLAPGESDPTESRDAEKGNAEPAKE